MWPTAQGRADWQAGALREEEVRKKDLVVRKQTIEGTKAKEVNNINSKKYP
jgi:hypothetical protein